MKDGRKVEEALRMFDMLTDKEQEWFLDLLRELPKDREIA